MSSSGHRPRKRFGQNFLHDPHTIENILTAIHPQPHQHIVEVGPGQGALTFPLLKSGCTLTAIELDRDLIKQLAPLEQQHETFTIIGQDVLKVDLEQIRPAPFRVVGNLPYNISTPLLFKLFQHANLIQDIHVMLQKEVVDRLAAAPGSKTYGRLSVMAQFYCQVEPVCTVSPGAFFPPPKVESAVVRLTPHTEPPAAVDPQRLNQVVTQAFSQRRKTLKNALKSMLSETQLAALNIEPTTRPENVSLSQYVMISKIVTDH